MAKFEPILSAHVADPEQKKLDTYLRKGGYEAAKRALGMSPQQVTDTVKASGLRGRGGAGFPTGVKWGFVPKNTGKPIYLLCNADESEPGTFKDRLIIENDPHQILEGMIIASWALGVRNAYIYIRGEMYLGAKVLDAAIAEAKAKGVLGEKVLGSDFALDIHVHRGGGAYICGEETALIESIEGKRGHPRIKPPFPAVVGVFGCPTVVNNVETLACLPHILNRGAEWFASIGTPKSTGPKLYCVSGHVNRPGVYELPMGANLLELLENQCGGIRGGKVKAVIPGGASAPVLAADELDLPLDFDSVAAKGSMLGSAAIVVMNDKTCMVDATVNLLKFFSHESCGQCTPCREGTPWSYRLLSRIEEGGGSPADLDLLLGIARNMSNGMTICVFGDAAAAPISSFIRKFRHEFEEHIAGRTCGGSAAGRH
jgi:NADH-quinone oxidoreductase subunit F